jgi:hypothetical protein
MSSDNGMDSILECIVPDACRFLLLHPVMAGA